MGDCARLEGSPWQSGVSSPMSRPVNASKPVSSYIRKRTVMSFCTGNQRKLSHPHDRLLAPCEASSAKWLYLMCMRFGSSIGYRGKSPHTVAPALAPRDGMRAAIRLPPGAVAHKNPKQLFRVLKLAGSKLTNEGMDGILILPHRVHQQ